MPPPREPRFEGRLVPQAGARREKHEVYTLAVCVPSGRERDPSAGLQGENACSQGRAEGQVEPAEVRKPAERLTLLADLHRQAVRFLSQMGRRSSRILTRRASEGSAASTQTNRNPWLTEPSLARRVSMTDHLEFGGDPREVSNDSGLARQRGGQQDLRSVRRRGRMTLPPSMPP